jgi:PleD family two-component response regulator
VTVSAMIAKTSLSQIHPGENASNLSAQKLALSLEKEHADHAREVLTQIRVRLNASKFNVDQDKELSNLRVSPPVLNVRLELELKRRTQCAEQTSAKNQRRNSPVMTVSAKSVQLSEL